MKPFIDKLGTRRWYNNNDLLHRDNDLPAVITANGSQHWFINGKRHRDNDLPAIIYADGRQHWYINGEIHRDNDLPAVITENGNQEWYNNGVLHRLYKPAIINANGTQYWCINEKNITDEVNDFIKEHDLPEWTEWTELHRILFRMRF